MGKIGILLKKYPTLHAIILKTNKAMVLRFPAIERGGNSTQMVFRF